MPLPTSRRKADVFSKLEYAEHRRNAVMDELFSAKKESRDPKFLIHAAAEVVSTARETFDYLGQDIVEQYLLHNTKNAKIKKKSASGEWRVYFPFHERQVKARCGWFHELKIIAPSLYSELLSFVEGVTEKRQISNTPFNYGWFMDLRNMVNEKKHDHLLAIVSESNQELLAEGTGLSMLIPKKKQQGWNTLIVRPNMVIKEVTEYRFAYNNVEVAKFCLFSAKATEIVVGSFYRNHFAA